MMIRIKVTQIWRLCRSSKFKVQSSSHADLADNTVALSYSLFTVNCSQASLSSPPFGGAGGGSLPLLGELEGAGAGGGSYYYA